VQTLGFFGRAGVYYLAPEVTQFRACRFWNNDVSSGASGAFCLIMDAQNEEGITSAFQDVTITTSQPQSFNEAHFMTCDFRRANGGRCVMYTGYGASRHKFDTCYAATTNDAVIYFHKPERYLGFDIDMHVEVGNTTPGIQNTILIDNSGAASPVFEGLKLKDHQPQCKAPIIDITTMTRQVIIDVCDIDVGSPQNDVQIFGSSNQPTGTDPTRFLVSGVVKYNGTNRCRLQNCLFNGEIISPENTNIQFPSGSYFYRHRPSSSANRRTFHKGVLRITGTTESTGVGRFIELLGSIGGSSNPVEIIAGADADANVSLRLTAKGTGGVEMASPVQFPSFTVATLPSAASHNGRFVYVSNGNAGQPCLAQSNGTSWLRIAPGSAVSAT
jgi:hypothetical protein